MRQVPANNNYRQVITLFILIMVDELGFWILLPFFMFQGQHLLCGKLLLLMSFAAILLKMMSILAKMATSCDKAKYRDVFEQQWVVNIFVKFAV